MNARNQSATVSASAAASTAMPSPPATQSRWVLIAIATLIVASFVTLRGDWSGLFSLESLVKMAALCRDFFPL